MCDAESVVAGALWDGGVGALLCGGVLRGVAGDVIDGILHLVL